MTTPTKYFGPEYIEDLKRDATPSLTVADGKWEGAEEWMPLAWELCANECGEEACSELIWEGGPIPEPWGDRWLKYEDQAKEMIAMVRKHVPAPQPPAQGVGRVSLADEALIDVDYLEAATAHLSSIPPSKFARIRAALAQAPSAKGAGHLTRFDAVQRALDLASLMGGSIGRSDRDSTEAYRAQLREHLFAYIPDAQAPAAEPSASFVDGDSPCVLEWGAVSLPLGDPSRVTELKLYPTLWAAIAEGALCGFDWRVYPRALTPPSA